MKYLPICALLLLFCGCPDETIQPSTNPLRFTAEDATCTEAFLKISLAANESNRTVTLKRGDSTIATISMTGNDSLFIDEGLLPKKTYAYTVNANTSQGDKWSATAQTTTMDTTSHNWTFTLDTLGESGSYLVDVAIINDTLAYAVGEIHIGDSLYNAAKWDGKKWELVKIVVNFRGNLITLPLEDISAFSPSDIWFVGSLPIHGDGQNWNIFDLRSMVGFENVSLSKVWGSNSSSLYFVGGQGSIVHYTGSWQKQESGTTLGLSDINGTSSNQLYACGLHYGQAKGIVLKKTGETWETIIEGDIIDSTKLFKPKLFGITEGLWVNEKNMLYTVGNLMYCNRSGIWSLVKSLAGNNFTGNPNFLHRGYLHAIDGNASNDVIIVGEINTVRHFNGVTWTQIGLPYQPLNYEMFWYGCNVKKDVMIAVGKAGGRATILTAKR